MLTKEFIEKVEALPFVDEVVKTSFNNTLMVYRRLNLDLIAVVETDEMHAVDTQYLGLTNLSDEEKSQLMDILWQYISTPVDEREPEKIFRMKVKKELRLRATSGNQYLIYDIENDEIDFTGGAHVYDFPTFFTYSKLKGLFTEQQLEWIEMTFDKEWVE